MKRYQLIATSEIKPPVISTVGYSDDPRVTRYGPAIRDQYIIHYVLSGKGFFNGRLVREGEGFLITPNMPEEYYPDGSSPWSFVWIISYDPNMEYFFKNHNADEKSGIFRFHNGYVLREIAKELVSTSNMSATSTQLSEIFLRIFNSCAESLLAKKSSLAKEYFDFSVNYVKANLHTRITVSELCKVLGITQPYLYRIFKGEVGCSPKQYISNLKIDMAKKYLSETELSVSRIAECVGFGSVLDFSKFFSQKVGTAPSIYRDSRR